jgi:hypothetical protein
MRARRRRSAPLCYRQFGGAGARRSRLRIECGGMAEWSMAVVLKTTEPGRVPGVRIPLPPPSFALARTADGAVFRPARGSRRDSARIPLTWQPALSLGHLLLPPSLAPLRRRTEPSSGQRAARAATRLESLLPGSLRCRSDAFCFRHPSLDSDGGRSGLRANARLAPRLGSNPYLSGSSSKITTAGCCRSVPPWIEGQHVPGVLRPLKEPDARHEGHRRLAGLLRKTRLQAGRRRPGTELVEPAELDQHPTADASFTRPTSMVLTDPDGNPILIGQHVPKPPK